MPGTIEAYSTDSFAVCVALITWATVCHQARSCQLLTSATGLFPTEVSGAGIGLGSTAGRRAGRCRFAAIARANVVARRFSLLIFLMIDPTIRP